MNYNDYRMVLSKKRAYLFVLVLWFAFQPIALLASQPAANPVSSSWFGFFWNAASAEEACDYFKIWRKNSIEFKDDAAFKETERIACERTKIEQEKQKALQEALENK